MSYEQIELLENPETYEEGLSQNPDLTQLSDYTCNRLLEKQHIIDDIDRLLSLGFVLSSIPINDKTDYYFYKRLGLSYDQIIEGTTKYGLSFDGTVILMTGLLEEDYIDPQVFLKFLQRKLEYSYSLDMDFFECIVKIDEKFNVFASSWRNCIAAEYFLEWILDVNFKVDKPEPREKLISYLVENYTGFYDKGKILSEAIIGYDLDNVRFLIHQGFLLDSSSHRFEFRTFKSKYLYRLDNLPGILDLLFENLDHESLYNYFLPALKNRKIKAQDEKEISSPIVYSLITAYLCKHEFTDRLMQDLAS